MKVSIAKERRRKNGWLAIERTGEFVQVGDQSIPGYLVYKAGASADSRTKLWRVLDRIMGGKILT